MPVLPFPVVSRNVDCNWVDIGSGEASIKSAFTEGLGNVIHYFWTVGRHGVSVVPFFKKGLGVGVKNFKWKGNINTKTGVQFPSAIKDETSLLCTSQMELQQMQDCIMLVDPQGRQGRERDSGLELGLDCWQRDLGCIHSFCGCQISHL